MDMREKIGTTDYMCSGLASHFLGLILYYNNYQKTL